MNIQFDITNIKTEFTQTDENIIIKSHKPQTMKKGYLSRDGDLLLGIQNNESFTIIFTFYENNIRLQNGIYADKLVIQSGESAYFNIPIILTAVTQKRSLNLLYEIEKYVEDQAIFKHHTYDIDFIYGYIAKETRNMLVSSKLYCYTNEKLALYFGGNYYTWLWSACMAHRQYFDEQFDINNACGIYSELSGDEYVKEFIKMHKNTWLNLTINFVKN